MRATWAGVIDFQTRFPGGTSADEFQQRGRCGGVDRERGALPRGPLNMATYVLIHGAGSDSWYWHRVVPELRALGHDVVAPDLPCDDDSAGLKEYADAVVDAIGDRTDLILVAQSMAGFTAPLVCARRPVDLLVMLAAMVPAPGESPGDWWANTGQPQAQRQQDERDGRPTGGDFDPMVTFLHDLPPDLAAE